MERIELKNPADLEKFLTPLSKGLKSHLQKTADHFKAIASHHADIAKAHTEHAAFAKGKHDAMDDGDVMKAFMGRVSAHHEAKAAHHGNLHKAYTNLAEENKNMADQVVEQQPVQTATIQGKAAGAAEPGAAGGTAAAGSGAQPAAASEPTGVESMISKTVDGLVAKALDTLNNSPEIANKIQSILVEKINQVVGDRILPSSVAGVVPGAPASVTRVGQPVVSKAADVPAEFSELVTVSE